MLCVVSLCTTTQWLHITQIQGKGHTIHELVLNADPVWTPPSAFERAENTTACPGTRLRGGIELRFFQYIMFEN